MCVARKGAVMSDVRVRVIPMFLDEESVPEEKQFIWAYCVVISNDMDEPVTLYYRNWNIIDDRGYTREVHGEGVVGETPTILPQGSYSYTSGAVLNTPSGVMFGSYDMRSERRGDFAVSVPVFSLDSPHALRVLH